MEYYNCDDDNKRVSNTQIFLKRSRIKNYIRFKETLQKCKIYHTQKNSEKFPLVVTYSMRKWDNSSPFEIEHFCSHTDSVSKSCHKKTSNCKYVYDEQTLCLKQHTEKTLGRFLCSFFRFARVQRSFFFTVVDTDDRSASNLKRFWQEEECRLLKISQKYQPSVYSKSIVDYVDNEKEFVDFKISGLGCKTNASLTLIAMDSLMHHHFAERLGVNVSKKRDKTVAVIVNDRVILFYCRHLIAFSLFSCFSARSASHT